MKYEVLPHVIDVVEAMQPDAPLLHDDLFTVGVEPKPDKPSNIAKRIEITLGDIEAGFAKADVIVEREFKTAPVHQGYIEPHAALATVSEDGSAELWCTTQGHYIVRAHCARLLGLDIGKVRVTASEIGGGFGGKTVVYLEPLAIALSRKAKRPVKMVMSREEVFKSSGPTSGATVRVKMGATKDGKFVAGFAELKYQAGAFQGSPVQPGVMCAYAPYDIENVKVIGYDVVSNRPKVAAYRAPGAPISEFAVESVVDEIAKKLDIDPIELRLKNAAHEGTKAAYGPKFGPIGLEETLNAIKKTEHWNTPLRKWQGRGVASGFWFNIGGETCASLTVNEDGTVSLMAGTPDIGGLRASLAMVAADELGIPYDKVRPIIGDTGSLGFNFLTGGSRSAFSGSMAIVEAAKQIKAELCARAGKLWEAKPDQVEFERRRRAADRKRSASKAKPMSIADFAKVAGKTGGPIGGYGRINAQGAGPSLGTHLVDLEVDPETGRVDHPALHGGPGRRQGAAPELRRGPVPGRRGAGHRLGAQRGVHLRRRRQAAERGLPRLPHARRLRRADDRRDPRRGRQPAPSATACAASARRRSSRRWRPSPTPWSRPPASASPSCRCPRPRCSRRSRSARRPPARSKTTTWRGWCWSATSRSSRAASPSFSSRRRP